MSIHSEHPFLPPEDQRSPLRRFRGRMPSPVSIWTTSSGESRAGWTVSSFLVSEGDPAVLLGLLDEDSDLWDLMRTSRSVAVSLLAWPHRQLSEVFAGLAPSPGGPFASGEWTDTSWGPVLRDAPGWLGARLVPGPAERAGWATLVRAEIEQVEVASSAEPSLLHLRGRYRSLTH